jgi:hypothetical protein
MVALTSIAVRAPSDAPPRMTTYRGPATGRDFLTGKQAVLQKPRQMGPHKPTLMHDVGEHRP